MRTIIHKADSRGYADHGWLKSYHTFSFAGYNNPSRMHFGALRVLNDDFVAGGNGFGRHPHSNMEIISIPLEGTLAHSDSMGNEGTIQPNEIQVMSAGTGVAHSEFNGSEVDPVKFLQIWLFPNKENVRPRYDQIQINPADRKNKLQQVISPNPEDEGTWIHQDAWFHLVDLDVDKEVEYTLKGEGTGVYIFLLEGQLEVADETLSRRDAIGITDISSVNLKASQNASVLIMEVPMV
ncbi:pirin family protein [Sphingobacterium bovistauri]|uniref:Pirin family protein n=1 Tax=Sphingobacterium bovistauri TaxID=2781959 RepID=A0ABS7ZAK1_9SPHI|nr:pirin family protein [Sphingobacterium bovistauri]MCA5006612.1 pirin family protein [Sphingobacterium bovistauri]